MNNDQLRAHLSTLAKMGTTNKEAILQLAKLANRGIITAKQKSDFLTEIVGSHL